jgi:hypothetical protein
LKNRLRKETNIYFLNERKEINMPYEDYNYPDEDFLTYPHESSVFNLAEKHFGLIRRIPRWS